MRYVDNFRRWWVMHATILLWGAILLRSLMAPHVALAPPSSGQRIADATGRLVAFNPPARRLLDLQDQLPGYLATGGDLRRIAAISPWPVSQARQAGFEDIFPALAGVRTATFARNPDIEQLLALDPDAVVAEKSISMSLRTLGFPGVFAISPASDTRSRIAQWRLSGAIDGHPERAALLLAFYKEQVQDIRTEIGSLPETKAVILFGGSSYWTIAAHNYYLNDVLALAHMTNVAASYGSYPQVNLEQLLLLDPDVILMNAQPVDNNTPEDMYRQPQWQVLRAVRERRVYKLPKFAVFLGPVEQALLVRWLAEVAHPGIPANFRAAYRTSYRAAYSYRLSDSMIDRELNLHINSGSFDYQRFAERR